MNNINDILTIHIVEFEKEIAKLQTEQKIIEFKNIFIKKYVNPLYVELKNVDDKKSFGLKVNEIKKKIEEITNKYLNNLQEQNLINSYCNEEIQLFKKGNKHPLNLVIDDISNFFKKLNFELINGNEIADVLYNFDNLNITKNHVARDIHDTFFIDDQYILRTHCTSNTALVLENNENEDIRIFSYGNVFRKDEDDATHSHQFMQIDFVWLKKDFNLSNLKWIIDNLIKYIFGNKLKTRYRLSYFPFTEPSFEVDVECWNCKNKGCNICKHTGWIEVLGAGMLHQNVINKTKLKDIDSGMAAGIGVERIAMLKYGIKDIRDFYNNDFEFLKQFENK